MIGYLICVLLLLDRVHASVCNADIANSDEIALSYRKVDGARGALQDKIVNQLDPYVSIYSTQTITNNKFIRSETNGGSVFSDDNSLATAQAQPFQNSVASIQTRTVVDYQAGDSVIARMDFKFVNPNANALMLAGPFSISDGLGVGYLGTSFGAFLYSYGKSDIQQLLVIEAAGVGDIVEFTIGDFVVNVTFTEEDARANCRDIVNEFRDQSGFDATFDASQESNFVTVIAGSTITYADFSFRLITESSLFNAVWVRRQTAQAVDFTWVFDPNGENATVLDPSLLNNYQFSYARSALGSIDIEFFNVDIGRWQLFHRFKTGDGVRPLISDLNFRLGYVAQWYGATDVGADSPSVRGRSFFAGKVGKILYTGYEYTQRGRAELTDADGVVGIVCVKLRSVFDAQRYRSFARLISLNAATHLANSTVSIQLRRNPDLIENVIWEYEESAESVMLVSNSFTNVVGGEPVEILSLSSESQLQRDFAVDDFISIYANQEYCITANVEFSGYAQVSAALSWREKQ